MRITVTSETGFAKYDESNKCFIELGMCSLVPACILALSVMGEIGDCFHDADETSRITVFATTTLNKVTEHWPCLICGSCSCL